MKKLIILLLIVGAYSTFGAMERFSLIKITNFDKSSDYRVLNDQDLKTFSTALKAEKQYFSKASSAAKKEWAKDEAKKGKRFPMLSARSMRLVKAYSKREDADKKLQSYAKPAKAAPAPKKGAKPNPAAEKKAKSAAAKQALLDEAIALITNQISSLSEGKVTVSLPGSKPTGKAKAAGNINSTAKDYKFKFTGVLYKTPGSTEHYIKPDLDVRVNGAEPWALNFPEAKGKKYGMDDTWIKKKVEISGVADIDSRGVQVKFSKLKSIDSLKLIEE